MEGALAPRWSKEWYAVYTIVRHEKAVQKVFCDKSIDTFLPLRETLKRWKDRTKKVHVPLFPGYLFVNIGNTPLERKDVLSTRSVIRVLGFGSEPTPVPAEQIHAIQVLLESKLDFSDHCGYEPGREVVVVNGPLRGIRGRIVELRTQCRLILSVDMIRRSVSVEVDARDVDSV
jgi:transcription antitermination factor NusG